MREGGLVERHGLADNLPQASMSVDEATCALGDDNVLLSRTGAQEDDIAQFDRTFDTGETRLFGAVDPAPWIGVAQPVTFRGNGYATDALKTASKHTHAVNAAGWIAAK